MLVALTVNVYSSRRYLRHKRHDCVKYASYFEMKDEDDVNLDDVVLDDSKVTEQAPMVTRQV